eukprot:849380-Pyramimonas_sp.AAC.1
MPRLSQGQRERPEKHYCCSGQFGRVCISGKKLPNGWNLNSNDWGRQRGQTYSVKMNSRTSFSASLTDTSRGSCVRYS